jgi:hypothetical protein
MPTTDTLLTDFTYGELSPKLSGRVDMTLYNKGCLTLENWVPFAQGGVTTRPGSKYLGLTKSGAQGVLIPFVLNDGTSYLIELTPLVARFWYGSTGALVGAPLELVTTYATIADLRQIRWVQDGTMVYLFHKSYPIKVITWVSAAVFTFASATVIGNTNEVPFSASGDYPGFGSIFGGRLWCGGSTNSPSRVWASRSWIYTFGDPWVALTNYEVDMVCSNDSGKLYRCITKGISAAATGPTGTAADITDGTVHWTYWTASGNLDFRYVDKVQYTVKQLKDPASWADHDIPELESITTYRDVLTADCAFTVDLGSDQCEDVTGFVAGDVLLIGTVTSEWLVTPDISAEAPWEKCIRRSSYGMDSAVPGLLVNENMIFAQSYATKLREYAYSSETSKYQAADLTFPADHILSGGIIDIDFALTPEPMVYCVRADGQLSILLYNRLLDSKAWHRYTSGCGGLYESVAVIGGTVSDVVYAIVNRGTGYRCVEQFDRIFDLTSIPLDSWVDVPASGATVTGLERFNTKTVTVYNITDSTVRTGTVTTGTLTLNALDVGDHIVVGAGFTCILQTMRVHSPSQTGESLARLKRVTQVRVGVYLTYAFQMGYVNTAALLETLVLPSTPYTGMLLCPFNGTWDRDSWVMAIQSSPYHCTILAMIPEVEG